MKTFLKKVILYLALFLTGLLAIPIVLLVGVISVIWNAAEKMIHTLE